MVPRPPGVIPLQRCRLPPDRTRPNREANAAVSHAPESIRCQPLGSWRGGLLHNGVSIQREESKTMKKESWGMEGTGTLRAEGEEVTGVAPAMEDLR